MNKYLKYFLEYIKIVFFKIWFLITFILEIIGVLNYYDILSFGNEEKYQYIQLATFNKITQHRFL